MKRLIVSLIIVLLLFSCKEKDETSKPWLRTEVAGHTFELVSNNTIEVYSFGEDGNVLVTIGKKGKSIAGPIFQWNIDDKGDLIVFEGKNKYKLKKISLENGILYLKGLILKKKYYYR